MARNASGMSIGSRFATLSLFNLTSGPLQELFRHIHEFLGLCQQGVCRFSRNRVGVLFCHLVEPVCFQEVVIELGRNLTSVDELLAERDEPRRKFLRLNSHWHTQSLSPFS